MRRHELTDKQWEQTQPELPANKQRPGNLTLITTKWRTGDSL